MPAVWENIRVVPSGEKAGVSNEMLREVPPMDSSPVQGHVIRMQQDPSDAEKKFMVIFVPHMGTVSMDWALMFRRLPMPVGTNFLASMGSPIDITRDIMANRAIEDGYEWAFFLDSDVLPPADVFPKLLSHGQPIVGGLYKARKFEGLSYWAAWRRGTDPEHQDQFSPLQSWGDAKTVEVDVTGCGCLLVHRSVLLTIRERFPDLPFFYWASTRKRAMLDKMNLPDVAMTEVSEDFWFCLLAKASGYKVLIDPSVQCEHLSAIKISADGVRLPGTQ